MKQLSLFPEVVKAVHLIAQGSPRGTFYRIWIEEYAGNFRVCKESGTKGHVHDRRRWAAQDFDHAESMLARKIKSKTNPDRKCPRKYQLIKSVQNG